MVKKGNQMSIKLLDLIDFMKTYDEEQMNEIRLGIEKGIDIAAYADPRYNNRQMHEIRQKLSSN